ncbi:MAG: branched-chain amino acid ABC transporter permease [Caldilineales bacterium]|nr:branched-chain amino acid ABC transporter permease [Caldilineales bacterium]
MRTLLSARIGGVLLLAAVVAVLPLFGPNRFYLDMATKSWLNAAVCIGLNLLIGYAGQISLGHAGFFALGAYASAILTARYGVPGLVAMLLGAVGTGLLAFVVARPILKLRGHYLAMATLGLGFIISIVLTRELWLTGGPDGVQVPALFIGTWRASGLETWYWIAGGAMVLTAWLSLNLIDSGIGRALRAVHGSEVAAETLGIDTNRFKLQVFALSAAFGALAGGLHASYLGFISPSSYTIGVSIEVVVMAVVGGLASIWGAVFGAGAVLAIEQWLRTAIREIIPNASGEHEIIAFGLILILIMIFAPEGLVTALANAIRSRAPRRWRRPGLQPQPDQTQPAGG